MRLAIVGGSGLERLDNFHILKRHKMTTQHGMPSSDVIEGEYHGKPVIFLARHGEGHTIAPHLINYRANISALLELGVSDIIAVAAVGGITEAYPPTSIAIPDQIIDYTHSRQHTFATDTTQVEYIDFTYPYTQYLRQALLNSANGIPLVDGGIYGATQGPRLETAAEIIRMKQDGCDLVGMTGMPEASLAREARMAYASLNIVANWAAGIENKELTLDEIYRNIHDGMKLVSLVLERFVISVID